MTAFLYTVKMQSILSFQPVHIERYTKQFRAGHFSTEHVPKEEMDSLHFFYFRREKFFFLAECQDTEAFSFTDNLS
jgi:hypothetical protein